MVIGWWIKSAVLVAVWCTHNWLLEWDFGFIPQVHVSFGFTSRILLIANSCWYNQLKCWVLYGVLYKEKSTIGPKSKFESLLKVVSTKFLALHAYLEIWNARVLGTVGYRAFRTFRHHLITVQIAGMELFLIYIIAYFCLLKLYRHSWKTNKVLKRVFVQIIWKNR